MLLTHLHVEGLDSKGLENTNTSIG